MAITVSEGADSVIIKTDEFKRAVLYPDARGTDNWNKTQKKLRDLGCVVTALMNSRYLVSNFWITVAIDKARLKEMLEECRSKPKKRRKRQPDNE